MFVSNIGSWLCDFCPIYVVLLLFFLVLDGFIKFIGSHINQFLSVPASSITKSSIACLYLFTFICCLLSVVCFLLSGVCYILPVVIFQFSFVSYLLSVFFCLISVVCYPFGLVFRLFLFFFFVKYLLSSDCLTNGNWISLKK